MGDLGSVSRCACENHKEAAVGVSAGLIIVPARTLACTPATATTNLKATATATAPGPPSS
eukprot:39618-Rhodomonas_salina.1